MTELTNKKLHILQKSSELQEIIEDYCDGEIGFTTWDLQGILEARVATNCCDQFKD